MINYKNKNLSSIVSGAVGLIFVAWSILVVTRMPVLTGFRQIEGDSLDGLLALGIELHWSNVFSGTAIGWQTTNFFFPAQDTWDIMMVSSCMVRF